MKRHTLVEEDLRYIWHPCTQMKDHETLPLLPIKKGEGVYLFDFEDNAYIDGVSSWWVNLFGHCNPYINQKVKEQIDTLEHVIFAGFTHEPIVKLSKRLCALAPQGLEKCFYADNGSSAIEVALKMSFQYHKNRGEKRPFFVSLSNSYHGETIGALAVGDVKLYKEVFEDILPLLRFALPYSLLKPNMKLDTLFWLYRDAQNGQLYYLYNFFLLLSAFHIQYNHTHILSH